MYYVSANHTLAAAFSDDVGGWMPPRSFNLGAYSTAIDTRSLLVMLVPGGDNATLSRNDTNSIMNLALLYYESPNGKVSSLVMRGDQGSFIYGFMSSQKHFQQFDEWVPNTQVSPPFTGGLYGSLQSLTVLYHSSTDGEELLCQSFTVNPISSGNFTAGMHCTCSSFGILFAS